jgi:hypothetical protein
LDGGAGSTGAGTGLARRAGQRVRGLPLGGDAEAARPAVVLKRFRQLGRARDRVETGPDPDDDELVGAVEEPGRGSAQLDLERHTEA